MRKKVLPKIFIFCEGEKTEPYYIKDYVASCCPQKASVIIIPPSKKNTPVQLVDEAIQKKKSKDVSPDDHFWVVYDRESKAKYSDKLHDQALKKAKSNNINVALSNICFEYWLLLHFESTTRPYSSFDNLMAESNFKSHLTKIGIKNYDKGFDGLFRKIQPGVKRARSRAEQLNISEEQSSAFPNKDKPYLAGCYVQIHKLLDAIDNL